MKRILPGVWIVAAVYIYFLIFAQFAFLRLARDAGLGAGELRAIMACMAAAGIASSLWTSRRQRGLGVGLGGCALAALLALAARGPASFALAACLIGAALGSLTVSLAGNIPRLFPKGRRGFLIGLGTGLAYAICNVPVVFTGSAAVQTGVALAACASAGLAWARLQLPESIEAAPEPGQPFGPLVFIFLLLIWLDSAAFYILQNTPALNQFGWAGASLDWENAGLHLGAAILAGLWLDRGGLRPVMTLAFACLAAAAVAVCATPAVAQSTHWFYAAGVSLYSAALVFAPVDGNGPSSARRAGVLYAIAGWGGSALGIGMAQDLHIIPLWFVGAACVAAIAARQNLIRAGAICAAGALVGIVGYSASAHRRFAGLAPDARLGREVYISEGCINCHSQYVRPGTADEVWWGPAADPAQVRREQPPLIGNRRQGPDLLNIGNRRSPQWNRLHLLDPRSLTPASRMPSYAYLFAPGDNRGEALLAYLASLGEDTAVERNATRAAWQPAPNAVPIPRAAQAALFLASCLPCHGAGGRGDGPLAKSLAPSRPRDLTRAKWQFIPRRDTAEGRRLEIARVIKFGISGTSMPGHETLDDAQVLGLAAYVESLGAAEVVK